MASQKSNDPGAAGTARGANNIAHESNAAIAATALILPHTRGLRNHVVTVRRAANPRHGRDWAATYNGSPEFSIKARQLRDPVRFISVVGNALRDQFKLEEVIDLVSYIALWPQEMDDIMRRIGGGA